MISVVYAKTKEEYVKKVLTIEENYFEKHEKKNMSVKELDKLCGIG